jgi:phosphoenolpyruvate carboxykinase (ATP)
MLTMPRLPRIAGIHARSLLTRPTEAELHALAETVATARVTSYGSVNVTTRVHDRLQDATFLVTDEPWRHGVPSISRAAGARLAALQDAHLAAAGAVLVDGFVGHAGEHRRPARLVVERAHAHMAAMQRHLYHDPVDAGAAHEPELHTICTPNLAALGYPGGQVIAVWLDEGVTRVIGTDYFGEAKKAGLRIWNERVYRGGGLVMHTGCKVVPTPDGPRAMLIAGLPDTGKTTTTFSSYGGARMAQDDFVALLPGGRVVLAEHGCIEKTWRLDARSAPVIHGAVTRPDAYLENVAQRGSRPDFADGRRTTKGRAVFSLRAIEHVPAAQVPPVAFLVILVRGDGATPAVVRLRGPLQAAAWYLARELRQPPRPLAPSFRPDKAEQGLRLAALLASHPIEVVVMNTGQVGGRDGDPHARKIGVADSAAILAALAAGEIAWEPDPDLGHDLATRVAGVDPELLHPRRLYARRRRLADYRAEVERRRAERSAYLAAVPGLDPRIATALDA